MLSRPKVIDREHDTVWTEAYIDSTVSVYFMEPQYSICHIQIDVNYKPWSVVSACVQKIAFAWSGCRNCIIQSKEVVIKHKQRVHNVFCHFKSQAVNVWKYVCAADGTIKSMGLQCVCLGLV